MSVHSFTCYLTRFAWAATRKSDIAQNHVFLVHGGDIYMSLQRCWFLGTLTNVLSELTRTAKGLEVWRLDATCRVKLRFLRLADVKWQFLDYQYSYKWVPRNWNDKRQSSVISSNSCLWIQRQCCNVNVRSIYVQNGSDDRSIIIVIVIMLY